MEAQQTSAEQPTEAALPAAETATETPSPIAAPPGVPMKAPPPSLLAKEEPKEPAPTPEIGQLITLTDDLQVVRFTNGTIHLKRAGKEPEAITPSMFDALLQSIRTQANASAPSAMSGFTGLASTNRGSAPGTDNDPIEWGDMDPNFRQALQDSPELLKAYNTVRNPKKVAKLDPATNSFTPTTNIELPPPSVETPPPQVTMENLSTVLATYHEQTVQPSLDLLSNHIRQDVISRLDKQGSVIRYEGLALQSLEADAIRRTVLIHGLPPFTTKSQIDHNLHYLLQQAQLTESDIQTTSNHVNTSTNAFLKITFLQESTSKHFFQTFKQKKRWYHSNEAEDAPLRIERDVPMLERIERAPLHAVIDSLTKPQPPAMDEYLRCDFNSLQVWDNAEESLLAQVLYLPDKNLSYACYLLVVPRFFEEVREHFPRFFGDKLSSTIQFMQAYAAASRHATTALRYHFSQTKDVSNISREDAIRSFPYPIYPIELHDELSTQLSKNPNFILQGFLGMQTQIQQAVSDLGINLEDYGRKGKGTARNKGKGKGKRSDRKGYQSDMYRNPAEEEEDTDEDYKDYKPKSGKGSSWRQGQNYWDRSNYAASSSRDTGKGSYSQWSDYRRPASSRVDYSGPKDRPEKWWKARDFDDYDPRFDELVQDSTRRRREDDRQQEGRHTRQRGRGLDDPTLYFPCEKLNYAMEVRLLLLMVMVSAMLARWLSLATLLLARMANFVLSSLLEWSRLLVHILQTHWEDKAPHWKAKIYHWYAFTNGTIHNWPPSLGPSVMARSQTNRHASGGMKSPPPARAMALPAFGVDSDEVEPVSPIAAEEAALVITSADDELLPRPEDDVEGQVADFLEQLPPGDSHKVVVDDQSARIEGGGEFLLRLLEPGRLQRLNSNLMTPAVAVSSKAAEGRSKCFGREGGDVPETIEEFAPVREAFRSYDQHGCGRIDMVSLAQVLKAGGLSEIEVSRLLQEAAGVLSASESVDYEVEASHQEVMARVGQQLFDWQLLDWAEEAREVVAKQGSELPVDWERLLGMDVQILTAVVEGPRGVLQAILSMLSSRGS
ncbi:hypothetical protein AK812_SmicGene21261 [Symbiodinium microadriaticum]|uniref:EF-hand domain-containing protein n=1 Tax=Symbiodinium microadriaticum TaxID=2951 RepID=A0A1Q9DMV3_SYMMI|nr:hypothetical protein AK812_SmicGene21261 [Symbiodinium microadriaticum]